MIKVVIICEWAERKEGLAAENGNLGCPRHTLKSVGNLTTKRAIRGISEIKSIRTRNMQPLFFIYLKGA
jgi:hypothetical protein